MNAMWKPVRCNGKELYESMTDEWIFSNILLGHFKKIANFAKTESKVACYVSGVGVIVLNPASLKCGQIHIRRLPEWFVSSLIN